MTPTLIEATTKPHNPGIDYDLFLKWNQPRTAANGAALAAEGLGIQRPVNDWCANADLPPIGSSVCAGRQPARAGGGGGLGRLGPVLHADVQPARRPQRLDGGDVLEHGLQSRDAARLRRARADELPARPAAARTAQYVVATSTLAFDIAHRHELLADQLENYRRGVAGAARPACCPAPFDVANNWMHEYPAAYVIPLGDGQRSDAEANNLVQWLLDNGIEVTQLNKAATSALSGSTGLLRRLDGPGAPRPGRDRALGRRRRLATDRRAVCTAGRVEPRLSVGRGHRPDPRGRRLRAGRARVGSPEKLHGGVEPGKAGAYALEIDSPTAVRTLNALIASGVGAEIATAPFTGGGRTYPAGTAIFSASDKQTLDRVGQGRRLRFDGIDATALPAREPRTSVPRIAVLTGGLTQEIWVLRDLGFTADPVATGNTSASTPQRARPAGRL